MVAVSHQLGTRFLVMLVETRVGRDRKKPCSRCDWDSGVPKN